MPKIAFIVLLTLYAPVPAPAGIALRLRKVLPRCRLALSRGGSHAGKVERGIAALFFGRVPYRALRVTLRADSRPLSPGETLDPPVSSCGSCINPTAPSTRPA